MRNHILRLFALILFSVLAGNIFAQDIDTCCVGEKEIYWVENYDATSTYAWSLKYGNGTLENAVRQDSVYVQWTTVGLDSVICVETNADACVGPDNKLAVETFNPPAFVDYTGAVTYCEGDDLSITANGTPIGELTYQWFYNGAEITGATNATLSITGLTAAANLGVYFCRLSTDCNDVDSDNLDVTVNIAPVITTQPTAATNMCPNTNLALSVAASGTAPISYQWQFDNGGGFVNMDGVANPSALTSNLTIVNVTIANNEGDYQCVVTNSCGTVTSDVASVNIWEQVVITSITITGSLDDAPADTLWVNPGSDGTITVNTTGEDLTYVWQDNLGNVTGGNNPLLSLTNLQQVNSGNYICTVSNDCGNEVATVYVGIVEFPVIDPQPLNHQICSDDALTLFINATGPQPLRYRWEHSTDDATWNIIDPALNSTAATNTLQLESVEADSAGYYRCCTWNQRWGDVTCSNSAEITLTQRPVLSGVDTAWATVNAPFTIDVTLELGDDIEYWWERHGTMLGAKQNAPQLPRPFSITHDITPMVTYADTGNYACYAENSCVSVGGPVYLGLAPEIIYQSEGFGGCFGIQGTLLVRAKGGPLSFVWEKAPTETGPWAKATRYNANDSTYFIASLANEDDGWYRCRVYNTHPTQGTVYTDPVKVTIVGNIVINEHPTDIWVCPDPPPRDTLKVSATGLGLRYAWFKTTTGIADTLSKDSLLVFPAIVSTGVGTYWCEVYDSLLCTTLISSTASLGIYTPAYFTGDETEIVYSCITLDTTLYAKGGGDNLRYIWKYDGIQQDPGDTLESYGPFEVTTADMGTRWTCDIYNECATIVQNFNIDVEIIPDITLTNMIDYYQCTGETINIPVTVSNSALSKPKYQWKKNSGNIYTGTEANLELKTLALSDTGYYSCLVYNRCTPRLDTVVQTDSSWVWVNTIEFQDDPYFLAGCLGDDYTFHIPAMYDSIYYVWRKGGIIVKGPDFEDPDYQFTNLQNSDAGVYDVTISNRCGAQATTATVSTNIPLAAITMPRDTTVALEGAATFVTTTNLQGSLISYQWYFKEIATATWLELTGATNNTFVRPYVELQHEGEYRCRIYNECDDIYTTAAALGIYKPPSIDISPADIAACEYDSVKLVVVASGDQIEYQWYFDGFQISGANSDTLVIPKASMAEAGMYWVVVSSPLYPGKDVISDIAVVDVIERMVLSCITENSACTDDDNGSISVQLTEGLPPYAYYWTPLGSTDSLIIDLSPDDYRVSVSDLSTCTLQKIIEVDEPDPLRLGKDYASWIFGVRAGGQGYDKSNSIVSDSTGNTYVVGAFSATADIFGHSITSYGQTDAFIAKFDVDGNNVWVKRAGGSSIDEYTGVAVDTLGNVYVTGFFNVWMHFGEDPADPTFDLYSNGMNDMVIAKYNSNGDIVWFKNAGGVFEDFGQSIHSDLLGNTYIAGSFQGISTWGNITKTSKGSDDAFVAKYSSDGVVQWVNQIGGYSQDFASDVVVDISESAFVTGDFQDEVTFDNGLTFTSNGMTDAFIAKYDFRGDFVWAKQIGGPLFDKGTSLDIDYTGNLFFTGTYQNEIIVDARTLTSEGESDIFFGKIDFEDNLRWIKSAGSEDEDLSNDLIVDVLGNQYITGTYSSPITFDTTTITCSGTSDFFVSKHNTEGHMVWLQKGGRNGADSASAITFAHTQVHHHLDSLYVTGTFTDSIQFGRDTLIAAGNLTRNDVFFSRLRQVLSIQEAIIGNVICHGQDTGFIEISVGGGTLPYTYEWTLENGAVVNTQDLYNIPDGTYKVKIIDANDCVLEKTFQVLYLTEPPLPPTHISASTIETCPNSIDPVRLESFGGTGDTLYWHTGSCDGPIIGNGQVIWVLPTETTTYFSNWVNDCGISQCASIYCYSNFLIQILQHLFQ